MEPPSPVSFFSSFRTPEEAVDAKAPLAGPLGQAGAVEDILKLPHLSLAQDRIHGLPGNELAVAEELPPGGGDLMPKPEETVLQGVAAAGAGEGLGMGEAGDMEPHPGADEVDRPFRHEAVGHELSAGDRDQSLQAVAASVVDQGKAAADLPVVVGHPPTGRGGGRRHRPG